MHQALRCSALLLLLLPRLALAQPAPGDAPLRAPALRLFPAYTGRALPPPSLPWKDERLGRSVRTGALVGGAVLALAGTAFCILGHGQYEGGGSKPPPVPICAFVAGLAGMALGAGIGALIGLGVFEEEPRQWQPPTPRA